MVMAEAAMYGQHKFLSKTDILSDLIRITFRPNLKNSAIAWGTFGRDKLEKLVTLELHKEKQRIKIAQEIVSEP